jgi:hypothetical protein
MATCLFTYGVMQQEEPLAQLTCELTCEFPLASGYSYSVLKTHV